MKNWSATTMSVTSVHAYPQIFKLGYLLYDKVIVPIPEDSISNFIHFISRDTLDNKIYEDIKNATVSVENVNSIFNREFLEDMWFNISIGTEPEVVTPGILRHFLKNLSIAGTRVFPPNDVEALRNQPAIDMMSIGLRLKATAFFASTLRTPILALPEELSILSGTPQEIVFSNKPEGFAFGTIRSVFPDIDTLDFTTIFKLRHSGLVPSFRNWVSQRITNENPSQPSIIEDLLELALVVEPNMKISSILAVVSNIPTGPIPNPVSVASSGASVYKAHKLLKKFSHLFLLSALKETAKSSTCGTQDGSILTTDRSHTLVQVPKYERDGNIWLDEKGRELLPNLHPAWIEAAGLGEVGYLVGSVNGSVYHSYSCSLARKITLKNIVWFANEEEANDLNWRPCKICKGKKS